MKLTVKLILMLLICGSLNAQEHISIIPKPVQMSTGQGKFIINEHTAINIVNSKSDLKPIAAFLNTYIKGIAGFTLPLKRKSANSISLSMIKNQEIGSEGYLLNVSPDLIDIKANTTAGLIYGLQSLFQTLPQVRTNATLTVPEMQITDYPRFKWRGLHLDVSRHFFTPGMVKEYINLLASYKLNRFHWHLVDDQGWRIEIKKYPELTKTGAWRVDQTHKVWSDRPQANPGEVPSYGGYYTEEQIKEIIAYAAERNVTVVPEIEMPGHVASAIAAYPFLSCNQKPQLPLTGGSYSGMSSNYCAGNEEVFTFLEHVLDEVIDLFPSEYIHIGGDEVDKTSWKSCPKCQARIKDKQLKNEEGLQSYFITRNS